MPIRGSWDAPRRKMRPGHPCYPLLSLSTRDSFQIPGHKETTSECKIWVRIRRSWTSFVSTRSQNGSNWLSGLQSWKRLFQLKSPYTQDLEEPGSPIRTNQGLLMIGWKSKMEPMWCWWWWLGVCNWVYMMIIIL